MIIDTHAHYGDAAFDADREELILSLPGNGIEKVIEVGASVASSRNMLSLIEKYPHVYGAIGVHPDEVGELTEEIMETFREAIFSHPKVLAVGEIGLDYYWNKEKSDIQKKWFIRQLQLARETKKPVIIHSREAAKDTFDIMKTEAKDLSGVIHCYSYSPEMAKDYVRMGYYIGVGGVVTFKNGKRLKETVQAVPMDRILLETDCPYLSPEPNRGKRNSSLNLPYVVDVIAELKGIPASEVIKQTRANAESVFQF